MSSSDEVSRHWMHYPMQKVGREPPGEADRARETQPGPVHDADPGRSPRPTASTSAEVTHLQQRLASQEQELRQLHHELDALRAQALQHTPHTPAADLIELDDAVLLQQVGIYQYHHPLENAEMYKARLAELRERIKQVIKAGDAILSSDMFAYNNSLAKGRKMTSDLSKLMLRAYNAEADNCVRSLRAGTILTATKRLETTIGSISKMGAMMEMRVSPAYHALRIEELELTADYLFKVQQEREDAREERERLREERKVAQELAAERERLDKEKTHYLNALSTLRAQGKDTEADELEMRLQQIDDAIAANDFRAANIRAGYVYVISNIGTFGPDVVKIGLTRRLEPMDRVRELGGASVPFPFDVHALYFSDDAVTLENELHKAFAARRLNHVNLRREFFFATPAEVKKVLAQKIGNLLEFNEAPEASQFYQSQSSWHSSSPASTI